MSTVTDPLKYRWIAYFDDQHIMEQPADDRYSKHDDKAEHNPSAFRDVMDYKAKLLAFGLIDNKSNLVCLVDLTDGHFEIGAVPFWAGDQNLDLTGKELQIIYFREVKLNTIISTKTGEVVSEEHFVNRHFIGWQVKGEDIKQTIGIG